MTLVTSAVGWTHPDAETLRTQMTAELGPRYASLRHSRPARIDVDPATVLVTLVVHDGALPVATASLRHVGGAHEVKRVFVGQDYRRRGLAGQLLGALEDHARELGVRRLVLQTGVRQPEAVELYERLGWQPVEPFGEYTGDQYSLCYAKEIS
ncbi:Acetyltransferase (GNAT) family protein [Sanguibacter gelidistatuariae]|uniref:Acetyltransferase (GNAT) family protein n=1 Tax=Sanguibacter gelidistatuariae TaxID=1814289 RepID=A0A1G6HGY2_9MICO|nr:GNAT family N-acetyltransferase [Sanguibacter gelidistatuariae]SDB93413.1 Acetyltransferase (GNAT) family protein [Sanguibacter gelidistatuariae]